MIRKFSLSHLTLTMFLALIFLGIGSCNLLEAQSLYPERQTVVGPSPQAAAITKYGDYPVNYNTGMVDMRVPIHTIASGSLSLPMDISFHASGRMANETSGILGMRWVLNAGGVVTRTVRGYPDEWDKLTPYNVNQNPYSQLWWGDDEWPYTFFSPDNPFDDNVMPTFDELYYANSQSYYYDSGSKVHIGTYYDSEFDVFRYQLPSGKSGQFIIKNVNGTKKALTIPYDPLGFNFVNDSNNENFYVSISITDTDGTIYNYGGGNRYEYYDDTYYHPEPLPRGIPTAWYLESIVSADKQDTIQLNYQQGYKPNGNHHESITISDAIRDQSTDLYLDEDCIDSPVIQRLDFPGNMDVGYKDFWNLKVPYLTSIDFKNGNLALSWIGRAK